MTENWVIHDVVEEYIGQEVSTTIYVVERIVTFSTRFSPTSTLVTSFLLEEKAKELVSTVNAWCQEKKVGGATIAGYPVLPMGGVASGSDFPAVASGNITIGSIRSGYGSVGPHVLIPGTITSGNPYYNPVPDPRESLICPYDPGFKWSLDMNVHYAYKYVELRF